MLAQAKLPRGGEIQAGRRNQGRSEAVAGWCRIASRKLASTIKAILAALALLPAAGVATARAPTSDDFIAILITSDITLDSPPGVMPTSDPIELRLTGVIGNRSYHSRAFPLETKAGATRRPDGYTIYHLAMNPHQKPYLRDFFLRSAWHAYSVGYSNLEFPRAIESDFCRTRALKEGLPLVVQAWVAIDGDGAAPLATRDLAAEARAAGQSLNAYVPACVGN